MFGYFKKEAKRDRLSEEIEQAVEKHNKAADRREQSAQNLDDAFRALASVREKQNG